MAEDVLSVLAFGAHPDDVEIGAAGILAAHAKRGLRVGICSLTLAELSSNGNPESRQQEAQRASEILGVASRIQLDLGDRRLRPDLFVIEQVVRVIRQYRPTVVLSPPAKDRHPDHEWCFQIVREALFTSGLRKYEFHEDQLDGDANVSSFKPTRFYQYMINDTYTPSIVLDVSEVYEQKIQSLLAYESQFTGGTNTARTPLNQGTFLRAIQGRDTMFGHLIGAQYAEGLLCDGPLLVHSLVD